MHTWRWLSSISFGLVLAAGCDRPVDREGRPDESFAHAGMGAPEIPPATTAMTATPPPPRARPLARDVSIEVVSWLVSVNGLKTPQALEDALNRKPGQFSRVDADGDGVLDYIAVVERTNPDGHAFELCARPEPGLHTPELVVATMMFDKQWGFAGHYDGAVGGAVVTPPPRRAASASAAPAAQDPTVLADSAVPVAWP